MKTRPAVSQRRTCVNSLIYKGLNGGPDGTRIFDGCFGVCMGGVKLLFFQVILQWDALLNTAVLLKLDRKLDKANFHNKPSVSNRLKRTFRAFTLTQDFDVLGWY